MSSYTVLQYLVTIFRIKFIKMMANNEEEIFYSDDDLSDSELYQVKKQVY